MLIVAIYKQLEHLLFCGRDIENKLYNEQKLNAAQKNVFKILMRSFVIRSCNQMPIECFHDKNRTMNTNVSNILNEGAFKRIISVRAVNINICLFDMCDVRTQSQIFRL